MSRFHDAMVRKQQAEAEQGRGQASASKGDGRVSILPVRESAPVLREVPEDVDRKGGPEDHRAPAPQTELQETGAATSEAAVEDIQPAAPSASRFDVHPAYERIIQRLLTHRRAKRENVYLVASAVAGEGASTVARNLAHAIGNDQSERVVLVDANLRTPSQHAAFGLPRGQGLVDVLSGTVSLTEGVSTDPLTGLAVLTSGSQYDSPPHLLSQPVFHGVVAALQAQFDWVIVDGPPVTSYPDSASLGAVAGGAVLVLQAERTRWEVADEAKRVLENSGTDILGVVLNRRKYHIPNFIYRRL